MNKKHRPGYHYIAQAIYLAESGYTCGPCIKQDREYEDVVEMSAVTDTERYCQFCDCKLIPPPRRS